MKKLNIFGAVVLAFFLAIHLPAFAASGPFTMRVTTDTPDVMPQGCCGHLVRAGDDEADARKPGEDL